MARCPILVDKYHVCSYPGIYQSGHVLLGEYDGVEIRLVGGENEHEGRVEVRYRAKLGLFMFVLV